MIRNVKHLNKEYLIVDTQLHITLENGETITVPIQVQVNISKIVPTEHYTVYSHINTLYNRTFIVGKKPTTPKKPWWKFGKSK